MSVSLCNSYYYSLTSVLVITLLFSSSIMLPWSHLVRCGRQLEHFLFYYFSLNYHWITLILQKALKCDNSEANAGVIKTDFLFQGFLSTLMFIHDRDRR